jgi:hypothetical protein
MGAALEESDSVRARLTEEAAALSARIRAQSEQAKRLRSLAERIEAQTVEDRHALNDLEGVLGKAAQLDIDDFDRRLGGQRLERVAIRLFREQADGIEEIHYRAWFDMVREAGYEVSGKNPLGTFLAQLNRSEAIERVGKRTGLYRLCLVA